MVNYDERVVKYKSLKTIIKNINDNFARLSHVHKKADIVDFPVSLPASDVSEWAKKDTKPTYTKSEIGLGNVGNFKAVSTVASQGLSSTEKANARANIGAGTSSFSGSYTDLTNKPTIPSIPSSLPANGGNAATVNGHNVESDVPANAKFTDTVYDDTNIQKEVNELVDNTLSVSGKASDSKVVGDKFKEETKKISDIVDGATSVGNAKKVNDHIVESDVPENAEFTDTIYDDSALKQKINILEEAIHDIKTKTPHVNSIGTYYQLQRTGKVYQTKLWKFAANPTSTCEKLLDNAGLEFEPSTDTFEGKDDYLNGNHPLFEWIHCNYERDIDGTAYPVVTEFDDNYETTGSVDVGAMQMSFYWNWDSSNPEYDLITISDIPNENYGLKPWVECVKSDGTVLPWCIGSAYISGIASDGLLRSQPDLKPERMQSNNNMITNYKKKGNGYFGAGVERNTFQIIFNLIKGATKNSQSLFQGCTNYSFQYSASLQYAEKHTYFPVTNAQANNIIVGSYVSVGYGYLPSNGNLTLDRYYANVHKYADNVKVLKIEALDENNKAIYLDIEEGFDTMPVALSDSVNANITITSMLWHSGSTDAVIGHHDGSYVSNANGKYPYRVQGREYAIGSYIVASNIVIDFQSDYSKKVYVAPKGVSHSSSDSQIRKTYTCVGVIPAHSNGLGSDYWIGDIYLDTDTGAWFPSAQGVSNNQGWCDILYAGGATSSGIREYLVGGSLGVGSNAGSCCLSSRGGLGNGYWYFCAAD